MRKLYESQMATLTTIYKSVPDLLFCKDINARYTSCNPSFEEFAGLGEAEIVGKTAPEIFINDKQEGQNFMNVDVRVLKEKATIKEEIWHVYPNGSRRLFENIKVPMFQGEDLVGLLGVSRDITAHRAAEEAAMQASRAKSDFLAKMSHEIRTPMNAIVGMTELALRAENFDLAMEHILTTKQACANLLSIINDILDFSKIETGKLEIVPVDYQFSTLANDVISIIRMRASDTRIRFVANLDSKIPNTLTGDETRIRQILLNLLSNAVKYTERGSVSFTASAEKTGEDTVKLIFEVKDSGRGIKPEDIDSLFRDYTQLDLEKNRGIEGIGLGLAITKSFVKAMNGEISVQSEYGIGSTFTVTIPQTIRSREPMAYVNDPGKKSVLVFERRRVYYDSILYSIENLGVSYTHVSSDSELLERMSSQQFAFVFISYGLFKKNKDLILKHGGRARTVVLTEFGEAIPDKNLNVLAVPVHSISIADILNGVSSGFSYSEHNELFIRFVAPGAKILVVDDISTNLKVAEGLLLPYKMKVDVCKSGVEAIDRLKAVHYDLIFMDHKMPGMDGVETTQYLRIIGKEDDYFKNVPIIALTANAIAGTKEMFLENGFNDFLSKPIDTVRMNTILEKWIPKEKQKNPTKEAMVSDVPKGEDITIEIEGVDTNRGIKMSGGTVEFYLETLTLFHKDGFEKIKEIKECLETNNLSLYTIHVHALKSASSNIGADALFEQAKALEQAGDDEDITYIEKNNAMFLINLELLLDKIHIVLMALKAGQEKENETIDIEVLKPDLIKLKTALNTLDMGTVNMIIDSLREVVLPESISVVVGSISDSILFAEYETAVSLIDTLLSAGKT